MRKEKDSARIIKDCDITHSDCKVVHEYIDNDPKGYYLGIDLETDVVFSPCFSVCLAVGKCEMGQYLILQYNEEICLRFTNLLEVYVTPGQLIRADDLLATSDKFVHFELLTIDENSTNARVYIAQNLWLYKHDPNSILDGLIRFDPIPVYEFYDDKPGLEYEVWKEFHEMVGWTVGTETYYDYAEYCRAAKIAGMEVTNMYGFDLAGDFR